MKRDSSLAIARAENDRAATNLLHVTPGRPLTYIPYTLALPLLMFDDAVAFKLPKVDDWLQCKILGNCGDEDDA